MGLVLCKHVADLIKKTVSIEAVLAGNISLSRVRKHSQMFLTKKLNTNYREEASN